MMSLVDYGSSSDDDVSEQELQHQNPKKIPNSNQPSSSNPKINNTQNPIPIKLPDASLLLNSSSISNFPSILPIKDSKLKKNDGLLIPPQLSGISNTVTEDISKFFVNKNTVQSRKRDPGEMGSLVERNSKLQKGKLLNSKNVPETNGGLLIPPQLNGKSNVVTEDISKLFVNKKVADVSKS